jgi:SAM-dependent methyltransferase
MRVFDATRELVGLSGALRAAGYGFVCVTPATHRLVNGRPGNAMARTVADVFGWNRPFADGVLPPFVRDAAQAARVLAPHPAGSVSLVRAAGLEGMLLLHSAFPTEAADAVFFGPDTYRFAQTILGKLGRRSEAVRRALDVGCGTGAGGLLVARAWPGAEVVLTDINPAAVAAARVNAAANGIGNVACREADLFAGVAGLFDLIVANPPYLVDPAKRIYRHGGGMRGEELSLRIVEGALPLLNQGGSLLLYTGSAIVEGQDGLLSAVAPMLEGGRYAWTYREVDPDVFGEELGGGGALAAAERIAAVVLEVTRR